MLPEEYTNPAMILDNKTQKFDVERSVDRDSSRSPSKGERSPTKERRKLPTGPLSSSTAMQMMSGSMTSPQNREINDYVNKMRSREGSPAKKAGLKT